MYGTKRKRKTKNKKESQTWVSDVYADCTHNAIWENARSMADIFADKSRYCHLIWHNGDLILKLIWITIFRVCRWNSNLFSNHVRETMSFHLQCSTYKQLSTVKFKMLSIFITKNWWFFVIQKIKEDVNKTYKPNRIVSMEFFLDSIEKNVVGTISWYWLRKKHNRWQKGSQNTAEDRALLFLLKALGLLRKALKYCWKHLNTVTTPNSHEKVIALPLSTFHIWHNSYVYIENRRRMVNDNRKDKLIDQKYSQLIFRWVQ